MVQGNPRSGYRSGGRAGSAGGPTDPHEIGQHTNVTITTPINDDVLKYQSGSGEWVNLPSTATVLDLEDLQNVDGTGKVDESIIQWNSTSGNWEMVLPGGETAKYINLIGVIGSRPTATAANEGVTYFSTDTAEGGTLHESDGTQWVKIAKGLTEGVDKADFDPNSVIGANGSGTPGAVTIGADELLGRAGATDMAGLTKAQVLTIINVEEFADATNATNVEAAGAVMETDYAVQSVLISVADNTPIPEIVANGEMIGRGVTGDLRALTKAEILAILDVEEGAEPNDDAAAILAKLITVDGVGSGLDADLLDGQHGSEFAQSSHTHDESDINGLVDKYVPNALFDANSIIKATSDNSPQVLSVAEDRVVGRVAGGGIAALTGAQLGALMTLNDIGTPTTHYDMGGFKLTSLGHPTAEMDATTWGKTWEYRTVRPITGATQTAELVDAGALLRFDLASPQTFTVPPNTSIAYPVGTRIMLYKEGDSTLEVKAGAGVIINNTTLFMDQYDWGMLVKTIAPDTWMFTPTQSAEEGLPPGGTVDQVLTKQSSNNFDADWQTPTGGGGDPLTTKGDLFGFDTDAARIPIGTDGQVLKANSAQALGLEWAAESGGGGDPLTTKGDLFGFDTDAARLPVGTDDHVLTADSTEALGVKWAAAAGGGGGGGITAVVDHPDEASYTLLSTDKDKLHRWNQAGPVVVTIPEQLGTAPAEYQFRGRGAGAVILAVADATGQTIEAPYLGTSGGSSIQISHVHGRVILTYEDSATDAEVYNVAGWDTPEADIPDEPVLLVQPAIGAATHGIPYSSGVFTDSAEAMTANEIRYSYLRVLAPIRLTDARVDVTSSVAGTLYYGIHTVDAAGLADALIAEDTFDLGLSAQTTAISWNLTTGLYVVTVNPSSAASLQYADHAILGLPGAIAAAAQDAVGYLSATRTAAALPHPATAATAVQVAQGARHYITFTAEAA